MKTLVIEKEKQNAVRIHEALRQIWCEVDVWSEDIWDDLIWDRENLRVQGLERGDYDALIIGLSDGAGLKILRRLRDDRCQLPVLVITEGRAEERIRCLDEGADYCLSEPFEEGEFLAALKAIMRRKGGFIPEQLRFGGLVLDHGTFVLSGPGGAYQLGKREFDVLHTLMVNTDMVVSKEFLLSRAWGDNPEAVENNVEVYISLLRKKLRELKAGVSVATVRNLGYQLRIG